MARFSILYVATCESLLGLASLAGVAYALRSAGPSGPIVGFYRHEAIFFGFMTIWCFISAAGTLRGARWAWVLSLLLGLFILASSALVVSVARVRGFGFGAQSLVGGGLVSLCAAGWLVTLFLPETLKRVWRSDADLRQE